MSMVGAMRPSPKSLVVQPAFYEEDHGRPVLSLMVLKAAPVFLRA